MFLPPAGKEADLLPQRLQVGLGIATGARSSLWRCQTSSWSVTDVRLAQLELQRLYGRVERQEQECRAAAMVEEEELPSNEGLRRQLQEVQALHHTYLEYEALATASTTRTNTAKLQEEYDQLRREKEALQGELQSVQEKLHIVQAQYHLLQQCLQDLKQEP
jgi:predicted  nucleic acid-binding Zn-ribbon protein